MPGDAEPAVDFDLHRFTALLDLAGPDTAQELTARLDEDLSRVAKALTQAETGLDHQVLRAQSHVLLAIAGTIGANRLYWLSQRLNALARAQDGGAMGDVLTETRANLDKLISRIRLARSHPTVEP